jgi:hypothetical protein
VLFNKPRFYIVNSKILHPLKSARWKLLLERTAINTRLHVDHGKTTLVDGTLRITAAISVRTSKHWWISEPDNILSVVRHVLHFENVLRPI